MREPNKNNLNKVASLKELSYMKYVLEYDVEIKEKTMVSSLKGLRYTVVESARQSVQDYTKKFLQMALVALFNKFRSKTDESTIEE